MEDVTKTGTNFLINKSGNKFADGAQYWLTKYEKKEIGGAKEELFFIMRNSVYDQIVLTHEETLGNISTKVIWDKDISDKFTIKVTFRPNFFSSIFCKNWILARKI